METAEIVGTMTEDEDVLAAAVLHDVLEDTSVTEEELRETVGGHVTELVLAVSENKRREQPAGDDSVCANRKSVERLLKEPRLEVKMIALGDKLSNIRALQRDYGILGEQVWERFNNKSKAEQGWYYQAVTDALQDLNIYPVWHELANLVWEVFWQDRDSDQLRFDLGQSVLNGIWRCCVVNAAVGTLCAAGVRDGGEKHGQTGIHRIGHGNRDRSGRPASFRGERCGTPLLQRNRLRPCIKQDNAAE